MTDAYEKVVELQIKVSNIEKSLDELSDMVAQQWRIIDGQKQMIASLESQLEGKQDREGSDSEPPPPHY
ncbi:MAG: SlyX family protein [Rhodospirillales bacterium]